MLGGIGDEKPTKLKGGVEVGRAFDVLVTVCTPISITHQAYH